MDQSSKEMLELIEGYVAGSLDAAHEERLFYQLATEARARQLYLEYMDLHSALHWTLHGSLPGRARISSNDDQAFTELPSAVAHKSRSEMPAGVRRQRLSPSTRGWAVAAACAMVLASAAALVAGRKQQSNQVDFAAHSPSHKPTVFRVTSGSATLDLPNVGQIVLEGPTELELLDPMRARLRQGRIRARVTEASGFVVEYPDGKVTDLGTEFGISVPPAGTVDARTSLVVFDGAVDLERTASANEPRKSAPVERLIQGEGVCFRTEGELVRVMSIVTGNVATFQSAGDLGEHESNRVILDVEDNLRSSDTKKFYEIVPGGFREDALCFVDRPKHEWNGVTMEGLPRYLIKADYIKTFCDDKSRTDLEIKVRLGRPADVYVLFRDQLEPPEWLTRDFVKTDDKVGMDLGKFAEMPRNLRWKSAKGAGNSVDQLYGVWQRTVEKPGVVTLGANRSEKDRSMYGIVVVALDADGRSANGRPSSKPQLEAVESK
jgi:hypothetical protein